MPLVSVNKGDQLVDLLFIFEGDGGVVEEGIVAVVLAQGGISDQQTY